MQANRTKLSSMKLFTAFIAVCCLSAGLRASVDPYDVVMATDPTSNTSVIRSTIPMELPATMELVSPRGVGYYQSEVAEGAFLSIRFPAKFLPTGKYILRISTERGRTSLPFEYRKRTIAYSPTEGVRTMYPGVDLRGHRQLIVSYPANEGAELQVALLNPAGQEVFADSNGASIASRKAYRLDNLSAGTYTLTIATDDKRLHSRELQLE